MRTSITLLSLGVLLGALFLGACSDSMAPPPMADDQSPTTPKDSDKGKDSDKSKDSDKGKDSDKSKDSETGSTDDTGDDVGDDTDSDTDTGDDVIDAIECTEEDAEEVCGPDGFCADGYCCDMPCTGSCEACNAPGLEGFCAPAPNDTVCRPSADLCDAAETCDGESRFCPPNKVAAAGTVCREAVHACDEVETCDGVGLACPDDKIAAEGKQCAFADNNCLVGGQCDADGACLLYYRPKGYACGDTSESECDKPDACDENGECQPNYVAVGTSCSSDPSNSCLLAGACDGAGACVGNQFKDPGASCGDATTNTDCDKPDTCDENGQCQSNYAALGDPCGGADSGNPCKAPGQCDGAGGCVSENLQDGTPCGDDANTDCDKPDSCLDGDCKPNYVGAGTSCNAGKVLDACETGDKCDGAGACQPTYRASTHVCREAVPGGCDIEEKCTGADVGCPADKYEAAGVVCRPKDDVCDAAEVCTGTSNTCPADIAAGAGQECGTPLAEYRCSEDACGAERQTRMTPSFCDGTGKTMAACKPIENPAWATLGQCDAANEICVPGATLTEFATCVPCDDAFAPDNTCKDDDVLYDYDGTTGTCVANQCVGYTPAEEACGNGCLDGKCVVVVCPSGGVEHAGYCWHKAANDKTNCIETCNSKGDGEGGILYYDDATRTYAGTVTAGSTANMANCGLVTQALGFGDTPSGIQVGKGTGCTLHGGTNPYFVSNLVTTGWEVTDYHHRVCACRRGVAAEEHCLNGWRSTPEGATCNSKTQTDRAVCKSILDCLIENNCPSVGACVNVNGGSTCLKSNSYGAAFLSDVTNTWNAMCQ